MRSFRFLLFLLLIGMPLFGQKVKIERVEPQFWWTDMKENQLQLLVHGSNISTTRPEIKGEGVSLIRTVLTDNPNYAFLYLEIEKDCKPGTFDILFKKGKKVVVQYKYELKGRREGSAERTSFSTADVVYLLMPDRFANGNPSNDSVKELAEKADRSNKDGRHGGDLQGIIDHLDYLSDLGITAIWSTPILEDNEPRTSYHTYAISDFYKVDGRYGSNEDYKRLAQECHKRGIKLIMDMVPNHCGTAHWWMKDLPSEDWIHQFDTFTRSNFRMSTVTDPYASEIDKKLNTTGWFDTSMPDLNQKNPLVLDYFKQWAIWWVEYADLDALRVDTFPYNYIWEAGQWVKAIREEYPNLNLVGECWQHNPAEIAFWQSGVTNKNGFDSYLPSVMDFPLQDALHVAFKEQGGWDTGMARFYQNFTMDYLYANPFNLFVFPDNHDTQRFATAINQDISDFKLAYTFLMTTRGVPQIYYGGEIMMGGDKAKGDGDIRRDFPGGWPGDARDAFTEKGRTAKENEAFNHLRHLMNWRKNKPVIHTGKMIQFIPENDVYVYFRYNEDERVMVVLNNNKEKDVDLNLERFSEMLDSYHQGLDVITGNTFPLEKSIMVKAKTGLVLELKH